jgi:hypothetical protein
MRYYLLKLYPNRFTCSFLYFVIVFRLLIINSNLIFINLSIGYIKTMPPKAVAVKQQPKVAEKKAWAAEDYVTMTIPIE